MQMMGIGRMSKWCVRGGARGYVVSRPVRWLVGCSASGFVVVVPAGFEFESSVPAWLRWVWSPHAPRYLRAAAVHDYMLESGHQPELADTQWLAVALSEGAPPMRTRLVYAFMGWRRLVRWLFPRLVRTLYRAKQTINVEKGSAK
jgi:hypothetical protein